MASAHQPEDALGRVRFNSDYQLTKIRDKFGRFQRTKQNMPEAHKQMALEAGRRMQARLRAGVERTGRPQVFRTRRGQGANRLVEALVDPQFQRYDSSGFTVLDAQRVQGDLINLYYRALEVGSSKFVGRQMRGVFFSPGAYAPNPEMRRRQGVLATYGGTGETATTQNRVNLYKHEVGGVYGTKRDGSGASNLIPASSLRTKRRGTPLTIHNPIPAYHYMRDGLRDWAESDNQQVETRKAFEKAGIRVTGRQIDTSIF